MSEPRTLEQLRAWLSSAPPGTAVQAAYVLEVLEAAQVDSPRSTAPPVLAAVPPSWRARLWTAPAETRIGRDELLEAIGRPRSWLYRHTSAKTIPHRKLDGELEFVVGEIRAWLREHEDIIAAGPMDSMPAERHLQAL